MKTLLSKVGLLTVLTVMGVGCCSPYGGGYYGGGGYPGTYNPACPGGNCGVGYGYAPQAAAYQPYGMQATVPTVSPAAPVALAPTPYYYSPYPMTAMNHLPTY